MVFSLLTGEYAELNQICKDNDKTLNKLLEERLAPFQSKISNANSQLISVIARSYEGSSFGREHKWYSLEEELFLGIITNKTKFVPSGESIYFMLGIKNPLVVRASSPSDEHFFRKDEQGGFFAPFDKWPFLYFMERPPKMPEGSYEGGCFGGTTRAIKTDKPRLELFIGDEETLPLLESLKGWQYMALSDTLGYPMPITEFVQNKIEAEQLEIYEKMIRSENAAKDLIKQKEKRLGLVEATDGIIHHGTHIELTDEVVEQIRFNPRIKEERDRVLHLLGIAVKRGYHGDGAEVSRTLDAGVIMNINLKEFFSQRKLAYKL
jgi:hypothetical protein